MHQNVSEKIDVQKRSEKVGSKIYFDIYETDVI